MSKKKYYVSEKVVKVLGKDILATRVNNDVNGNPRWVVHFSDLGLSLQEYQSTNIFTKYRANWFTGGYIFQAHNIQHTLEHAMEKIMRERGSSYKVYDHKNKVVLATNSFINALECFKRQQGYNRSFRVIQGTLQSDEKHKQIEQKFYGMAFGGVK